MRSSISRSTPPGGRSHTDRYGLARDPSHGRDGAPDGVPRPRADRDPVRPELHLDYLSPCFNAVTARRLPGTAEIEVVFLDAVTCDPRMKRQRYELLGDEELTTPVGRFAARRWRYTALSTGWSRELWVAGDVVVRYESLFELESYEPGASGPVPLG